MRRLVFLFLAGCSNPLPDHSGPCLQVLDAELRAANDCGVTIPPSIEAHKRDACERILFADDQSVQSCVTLYDAMGCKEFLASGFKCQPLTEATYR